MALFDGITHHNFKKRNRLENEYINRLKEIPFYFQHSFVFAWN